MTFTKIIFHEGNQRQSVYCILHLMQNPDTHNTSVAEIGRVFVSGKQKEGYTEKQHEATSQVREQPHSPIENGSLEVYIYENPSELFGFKMSKSALHRIWMLPQNTKGTVNNYF